MEHSRECTIAFLTEQKRLNPNYTVIDLGGSANSWSQPVRDFLVDYNASANEPNQMAIDLCDPDSWNDLLAKTNNNLFDYAICTHTLEDLYDPFIALKNLPKIAKAGIITTPSILTECSYVETKELLWRGYMHHRWLFDIDEETHEMLVIPKINYIDSILRDQPLVVYNEKYQEIRYNWTGSIKYKKFMNGYLGPTPTDIANAYNNLLNSRLNYLILEQKDESLNASANIEEDQILNIEKDEFLNASANIEKDEFLNMNIKDNVN
jgi:hypothetical protein